MYVGVARKKILCSLFWSITKR